MHVAYTREKGVNIVTVLFDKEYLKTQVKEVAHVLCNMIDESKEELPVAIDYISDFNGHYKIRIGIEKI